MNKNTLKFFLFAALCSVLTACSPFGPIKQKPPATFLLDVDADVIKSGSTGKVLFVSDPVAVSGFDTTNMAYVQTSYQLNYFSQNRWVDTPSHMLQSLMVDALQNTNHFKAVVAPPFTGRAHYDLDTTIVKLQQNFVGQASSEQLVVRVQLLDNASKNVIAVKLFSITEPAPFNTPYGGVIAANSAVKQYLQQLARFVVDYT